MQDPRQQYPTPPPQYLAAHTPYPAPPGQVLGQQPQPPRVAMPGTQQRIMYPAPMMTTARPTESSVAKRAERAEAAATASARDDPVLTVAKALVVLAFVVSTHLVPTDLRFLWLMVIGLLVVGEMGQSIFHMWIETKENHNSALWVLYITTGTFVSVLLALLLFLGLKVTLIMQRGKHDNAGDVRAERKRSRHGDDRRRHGSDDDRTDAPAPSPPPPREDPAEKYKQYVEKDDDDFEYENDKRSF